MSTADNRGLSFWVLLLSLASGYANVTAILGFGQPVSHVTGSFSNLALALIDREAFLGGRLLCLLLLFLFGSILAGIIFSSRRLEPRRHYGLILFLFGVSIYLARESSYLLYLLSFIMGLQNSFFLGHRGQLVRSTHLTGYLSDLGFELGALLAGRSWHSWKVIFYLLSIGFFILGGVLSAYLISHGIQVEVLALLYLFLSIYYCILRREELFMRTKGRSHYEK